MKQVLQSLKTGLIELADTPAPRVRNGHLLIRTNTSLISAGTERMLLEFGKANWVDKARQQPDKIRLVLEKVKTDGLMNTLEMVQSKLDKEIALGYCNCGEVLVAGAGVDSFRPGDRVVSNSAHAEVVQAPVNLCARVPEGVSDESAAFTVIGAIALQGIRLAQPTLGEFFVVTGLGLVGLMAVQLLRAHGCRVLGIDFDSGKVDLARQFGAEGVYLARGDDPVAIAEQLTGGRGMDGVLITASTKSNEPVHQAAQMCRKRGRIVLVGVTGLELSRDDFYQKELSFQVSCSYGPGRYDSEYEQQGHDYPYAFVRWTEQRNFEAVLGLMSDGRVDVAPLITHRFDFDRAEDAYQVIQGKDSYLGIVLNYPRREHGHLLESTITRATAPERCSGAPVVGFIGAGNYSYRVLMPAFKAQNVVLKSVASRGGMDAAQAGRRFGFESVTSDIDSLLASPEINTVVVATRHDSHAALVCRALESGKHVFVEKPLAITREQLAQIEAAYGGAAPILMVGFNRRFAPLVRKMKALLTTVAEPKAFIMTVNAGKIPPDHWLNDPAAGGGRLIGEGCHFVDLLRFLAGAPIAAVRASSMSTQTATFTIEFEDRSIGTVHYLANGDKSFPKERLEVFCAGRVLALDNFRSLTGYGWPGFKKDSAWKQDKGNVAAVTAFVAAVRTGAPSPIRFAELVEITRATLDLAKEVGQALPPALLQKEDHL